MAPQSNARVTQQESVGTTSRIPPRIANLPIHRSTGLIELSDQYEILSVNETIQKLAGITGGRHSLQDLLGKDAGRSVEALFQAPDSLEYEVELLRVDGRRIPVAMAFKRLSFSAGRKSELIVTVRSLVAERATAAVRDRIRSSNSANEVFRVTAEEVCKWVPFVHCAASVYDNNLKSARVVFGHGPLSISWPTRWFDLSPEQTAWLRQAKREAIPDLHAFYKDPRWKAAVDPDTVQAMAQLESAFRIPVVRHDRVMGSINFFRDVKNGFSDEYDVQLLNDLPIDNAFLMALSCLENEELRFKRDLMEQLASRPSANMLDKSVSEIIVNRLAKHYDWDAISIWRINCDTERFELQAKTGVKSAALGPNLSQGLGEGVMGEAYKNGELISLHDVPRNEQYRHKFVKAYKFSTLSELCVPIRVGSDIVGMLNIEDSRRNAFAAAEVETITGLIKEVRSLLEHQKDAAIIKASFDWTPSALFVTRDNGSIDTVNPTALQMLGYQEAEVRGKPLIDFLEPPELVRSLLRVSNPFRDDMSLVRKDGKRTKVSIASSPLGEMMGAIVTARDLASRQRIEELEGLDRIFYDIAAQTKVPLALAFSWLTKLKQQFQAGIIGPPHKTADDLDKVIRQLKRVEITHDHLALYDKNAAAGVPANPVIIEAGQLLDTLIGELPTTDSERIQVSGNGLGAYIIADVYQASFVLLSLLSYVLRLMPESKKLHIVVSLEKKSGREWVRFALAATIPTSEKIVRRKSDIFVGRVISDINLGTRAISEFVQANGGSFDLPKNVQGDVDMNVTFPVTHIAG